MKKKLTWRIVLKKLQEMFDENEELDEVANVLDILDYMAIIGVDGDEATKAYHAVVRRDSKAYKIMEGGHGRRTRNT